MTYDALGKLLDHYDIRLEDVMSDTSAYGLERTKFGKVKITNWDTFAKKVGLSDADMDTPEYMEAYSDWVESRAKFENKEKERVEAAVDELKGLTEAKPNESINVSHLEAVMGDSLVTIVEKYGGELN